MKTVANLRVSTAQQDSGGQRVAILEYVRRQGFRIDDFIEATASARTKAKHRRLDHAALRTPPRPDRVLKLAENHA